MQRAFCRWVTTGAIVLSIAGCSGDDAAQVPTGTVQGQVTLDDKPVTDATIVFFAETAGVTASGVLGPDGTYTLKYGDSFSVPAGDYRVSFGAANQSDTPPDPQDLMTNPDKYTSSPPPVPEKYRSAETSGLIAVVKEGTNDGTDFQLTSN